MHFKDYLCLALAGLFFMNVSGQQVDEGLKSLNLHEINQHDFSFLNKNLADKQFVLIGESSHGVSEFGEFKKGSVEYLTDSLGFSTILIESGFSDILKWTESGKENYDSLVYSLFPIWHTRAYLELFQFLKNKKVKVYGIDPQNSSKFFSDFPYQQLVEIDKELATVFYQIDREWSKAYSKPIPSWDSGLYDTQKKAIAIYEAILKKLNQPGIPASTDHLLLKRVIENRLSLAKAINKSPDMFHRDSIMKDNVDWLLKNVLSKNDKAIILSHNSHVAKEKNLNIGYLGYLMNEDYPDKTVVIGQYFESGNFSNNLREVRTIPKPAEDSFESYLTQFQSEYQFFDLHSKGLPKQIFNKKINTYYMGGAIIQNMVLSKNYDLIFTVKHANPPKFID